MDNLIQRIVLKLVINSRYNNCISILILVDKLQRHSDINKESTRPYSSVYPYQKSKYGVDQHKLVSPSPLTKKLNHEIYNAFILLQNIK